MAAPTATVVVCTRDRLELLEGCLDSLDRQVLAPDDRVDVVVVDNGSTDGTTGRLHRWAAADPGRRTVVHEPVAGLSRARNRGLAAASGDVVLFLDDDAIAPRGWVAAHLAAYRRDPAATAVGGPVVLTWPEGRPRWVTPGLEHWYSAVDHGDEPGPFPRPHGPYGTNMSVRREAALAAGGFAEQLGRRGRRLRSGEEADLWARLWAAGGTIVYDPATLVLHRVTGDRSRRRWLLRRGWGQGRTNAAMAAGTATAAAVGAAPDARTEARFAARLLLDAARAAGRRDQGAALDALARATGHTAAALTHIAGGVAGAAPVRWRPAGH
ncbi:MAG TPA: glycosyltransferase family A protein [Acidimicrobiales bacterium]